MEIPISQFIEMFGDPITNDKKLPVEPLSKHIELLGGFAFKSTGFVKEGIPVLRIGNINAGYFRPDDLPFWKYDKALDRYLLYPGDLAISLTGTVGKDDYGNVCRLGNDYPRYYLNQRNAKLILKDTVLPELITALLKSRKIKDKIANAGVGVRQANISNKSILELKVPIPNLDGQNQFADFVRQSDKSKFACLKSQFIEMFGDPESVIDNAINTVADVADVQVGLVIKPTRFYSADGTGTPAFRSLNIGEMYIRDSEWIYFTDKGMVENQRTIAHTGDVLVVRSGYPGTSCVVTPEYDGRNVVDLIIAHPNVSKILPEFLCAFTNYPHGKIQIENSQRGVAQKHLNVSLYNKMKIVVPPMELQKQFVQLLHQSDKSKLCFHLHTTTLHYAHS